MKTLFLKGLVLCLMLFTLGCESQLSLDDLSSNDFNGDLPESTQVFIQTEYQGYEIYDIELDDFCDDVELYEVELEDGPGPDLYLYFSLDWTYLFSLKEIDEDELTAAINRVLETNYGDYSIEDDEVYELSYPDGTKKYFLELEKEEDAYLEIIFNSDGSVDCLETDD